MCYDKTQGGEINYVRLMCFVKSQAHGSSKNTHSGWEHGVTVAKTNSKNTGNHESARNVLKKGGGGKSLK